MCVFLTAFLEMNIDNQVPVLKNLEYMGIYQDRFIHCAEYICDEPCKVTGSVFSA